MIIAYDIGGANIKIALIEMGRIILKNSFYFPFWKEKNNFVNFLFKLLEKNNIKLNEIDAVGVTMTAELSDAFQTKDEGVNFILNSVESVFSDIKIYVLSNNSDLISIDDAKLNPYSVASANWAATSWYAAKKYENCLLVDIGSTTTDIIPIKNGKIAVNGKTDLERLQTGELIYTGILRTNIAAITDSINLNNKKIGFGFLLHGTIKNIANDSEAYFSQTLCDCRSQNSKNFSIFNFFEKLKMLKYRDFCKKSHYFGITRISDSHYREISSYTRKSRYFFIGKYDKKIHISSELFATTADVYRILNEITEMDYSCETADGRGKGKDECMARLARVLCADTNELSENEIIEMAEYIKDKQIKKITDGILRVKNDKIEKLIAAGAGSFLTKEIGKEENIPVIELDINSAAALGLMVEEIHK